MRGFGCWCRAGLPVSAEHGRNFGQLVGEIDRRLAPLARDLAEADVEILSTGGTAKLLRDSGIAVSFERGDYFFFYDSEGRFRARLLIDKPPWYEVTASINLQEHFARWQPALLAFLQDRGLPGDEVMFNTGDLEKGAIPFIYVNTRSKLIVLIRYDELPDSLRGQVPGSHLLQSLWHFIGSHTYSIPMRPYSSLQSLMAMVTDTAIESGKSLARYVPPLPQPTRSVVPGRCWRPWSAPWARS